MVVVGSTADGVGGVGRLGGGEEREGAMVVGVEGGRSGGIEVMVFMRGAGEGGGQGRVWAKRGSAARRGRTEGVAWA